jgi:prepilin-type N-terminal cleavage/methylation domain-containing protein
MRGLTLVEVSVVLVLLGLLMGMGILAVTSLRPSQHSRRVQALARQRAEALREGRAVTESDISGHPVRFLPDGRALGAGIDPLTGEIRDESR